MRCDDVEVRLDCLRTGELATAEKDAVERHLNTCPECRDIASEIESVARSSRRLLGECAAPCITRLEEALYDRYDRIETDRGPLFVAFSARGISRIHLRTDERGFVEEYRKRFDRELHRSSLPDDARQRILRALEGSEDEPLDVDLSLLSPFEQRALEALQRIPRGEVRTYAWLAREAGNPAAIRAAGNACAKNPIPFVVPCHRVVPSSGGVGSYGYGSPMKRELLSREGVQVDEIDRLGRRGFRYLGSAQEKFYCFPTCRAIREVPEVDRVAFHDDRDATGQGYEPCEWCRPLALSA